MLEENIKKFQPKRANIFQYPVKKNEEYLNQAIIFTTKILFYIAADFEIIIIVR